MNQQPKKILIIRLSSLGDIVNLTVIFSKLRQKFPKAVIEIIVKKQFQGIVKPNSYNITVTSFDPSTGLKGWLAICREKQSEGVDLFIDMHNNMRSWLLRFFLRNSRQLHYKKPYLRRFLLFYLHINLFPKDYLLVDEYLKVLSSLGIETQPRKTKISLSNQATQTVKKKLIEKGIHQKFAVITPISAWKNKRYPIDKYFEISQYLVKEKNLSVIWLGGKNDQYLSGLTFSDDKNILMLGETSLQESIALLEKAEIVVSNDTGLPYAAQAVGTPAVIIFGPSSRETSAGYIQNGSHRIEKDLWCRPCSKGERNCFRKEQYCMQHSQTEIFHAIDHLLSEDNR